MLPARIVPEGAARKIGGVSGIRIGSFCKLVDGGVRNTARDTFDRSDEDNITLDCFCKREDEFTTNSKTLLEG